MTASDSQTMDTVQDANPDEITAPVVISDPGERNREAHSWVDRMVINIGNTIAWIFPILMVAIVSQVFMRKAGHNQAWLDDGQWWLYGFAMLGAFGYAITTESHVRVDLFHQNFSEKKKARIEVFALGWLLLPFIAMMTDILMHYSWASFVAKEGSDSPNGLHRLYLLKLSLPVLFTIAGIAAWAALKRNFAKLGTPHLWKLILCSLPFCIFVFERIAYNALYWYVRISQPDIKPRRIAKEPIMENSLWIGLVALAIVFVLVFVGRRRAAVKG